MPLTTPRTRATVAVAALAAGWLLTRAAMVWLLAHDHLPWLGSGSVSHELERLYTRWRETLDRGAYPAGDPLWQYPPGAGPALLVPGLLMPRLPYPWAFTAVTLAADAAVTAALVRAGLPRRATAAATATAAAVPGGDRGRTGGQGELDAPGLPGNRGLPGGPGLSSSHGRPGNRSVPGVPGLPGNRGRPGNRSMPGVPGNRGLTGGPGLSSTHGRPGVPGLPGNRGRPGNRSMPGVPGNRGLTGGPGLSGSHRLPGNRGLPAGRDVPGGRSLLGALLWTAGLPLLLHLPLARFDVQVTALAVFALLALDRLPRLGGALAALGALAKAWPLLILIGAEPGRTTRRAWTSAAVTAVTLLALLASLFTGTLSFVRQQGERGVQIESLGGTLLSLATHAGWPGQVRYQYGAMELVGPGVGAVAAASLALTFAVCALIAVLRLRAARAALPHGHWPPSLSRDAALAAVLLLTVTSRVISPQYMIWLLGLAAVCLALPSTTQRPVALLVTAATAVSALAYPVLYEEVMARSWTGCLVMTVRNGLLVAAAVLSCVRVARLSRPTPAPGTPLPPADARCSGTPDGADAPSPGGARRPQEPPATENRAVPRD